MQRLLGGLVGTVRPKEERVYMPAPVTDLTTALITGVTAGLVTLIAAVPAILGALVLLILGWIIAGIVGGLIARGLRAIKVVSMPNAKTLGMLAYAATFGFGVIAAATQIGVAAPLVEVLFAGIVFGLALAFGLAFGLGGREEAAQMWRGLRGSVREVASTTAPTPIERHGDGRPFERSEASLRR